MPLQAVGENMGVFLASADKSREKVARGEHRGIIGEAKGVVACPAHAF